MVKASVVWLNYNSSGFIDITLNSLTSFMNLDFDNYELIIIDNASTDGSFKIIKRFVDEHKPSSLGIKIIHSNFNSGYAGGMNLGWDAKHTDTKYVAFVNNDLVAEPESLRKIIEFMEDDERIGAASGLIYYGDGKTIYSAGWTTDDILTSLSICNKATMLECPTIAKPYPVTYADGAYCITKVDVVKKCGFDSRPFIDETFLYADDILLGMKLWNMGYASYYVPVIAGIHYVSMTTKSNKQFKHYPLRAKFISYGFIKVKFSWIIPIYYNRIKTTYLVPCKVGFKDYCAMYNGVKEGYKLGKQLAKRFGRIYLEKVPHVKLPLHMILLHGILPIRTMFAKNRLITHDMLTQLHVN